jgi:succinoglycan biosynthesis transport protein ExoP
VGLAYFIEYLDTSVKTVDDVERYLNLSVVGVIPQKVRPLVEEGAESPHAEAYRVLRTNMQFTNKGVHGGAFAVVSGGVGEGKSTTLFNLAYICAQHGRQGAGGRLRPAPPRPAHRSSACPTASA